MNYLVSKNIGGTVLTLSIYSHHLVLDVVNKKPLLITATIILSWYFKTYLRNKWKSQNPKTKAKAKGGSVRKS